MDYFFALRFFALRFLVAFFGTFLPLARASERPIAIACFLLFTGLPERPPFRVPALRFFIARSTSAEAFLEYFRAMDDLPVLGKIIVAWYKSSSAQGLRPSRRRARLDSSRPAIARAYLVIATSGRPAPARRALRSPLP